MEYIYKGKLLCFSSLYEIIHSAPSLIPPIVNKPKQSYLPSEPTGTSPMFTPETEPKSTILT